MSRILKIVVTDHPFFFFPTVCFHHAPITTTPRPSKQAFTFYMHANMKRVLKCGGKLFIPGEKAQKYGNKIMDFEACNMEALHTSTTAVHVCMVHDTLNIYGGSSLLGTPLARSCQERCPCFQRCKLE